MSIARDDLEAYLIERGLLEPQAAIQIEREEGRSNAIYRICIGDGGGLFVKIAPMADPRWTVPLAREAELYRLIGVTDALAALRDVSPRMISYDSERSVLVLELFPHARNLTEYHQQQELFPVEIGGLFGRRLAQVHAGFDERRLNELSGELFLREPPWGLRFHQTDVEARGAWREPERAFVATVDRDVALTQSLDALADDWRVKTLIHGDLKWDNCLLIEDNPAGGTLRFVDWEGTDVGDPAWDVAGALQGYLAFWVLSLQADAAKSGGLKHTPWEQLQTMHPSIREFVRMYLAGCNLPPEDVAWFMTRCVRFAGARLLLAVFEYPQMSPASLHNVLQLSRDLLLNTSQAATGLLGIGTE